MRPRCAGPTSRSIRRTAWCSPGGSRETRRCRPARATVEIVLRPEGDATVVELTHRDLPVGRQAGHRQGWTGRLGVLASILQE